MNVFVVHAHPEPRSFCAAMTETARQELEALGHPVIVSDLYRLGFEAVASPAEFPERTDSAHFRLALEQEAAAAEGRLPTDVSAEQEKLRWCDALILQFPLWWFSMPAILKGWVDRVLTRGFAYGPDQSFASGGLRGRRAMLAFTTGAPEALYAPGGRYGALDSVLHPIHHGVLRFVGFEVLPPFPAWAVGRVDSAERSRLLESWRSRLRKIEAAPAMAYPGDDVEWREML